MCRLDAEAVSTVRQKLLKDKTTNIVVVAGAPSDIPESWMGHSRVVQMSGPLRNSLKTCGFIDSAVYIAMDAEGKVQEANAKFDRFLAANKIDRSKLRREPPRA